MHLAFTQASNFLGINLILVGYVNTCGENSDRAWTQLGDNCYHVGMKEMNWADAQIYCRETGGFLAEIFSKEEEILLDTFLIGGKSYWLGLTDKGNEGI